VLTAKRLGSKDVSMFIRRKIFDMRITKNEMNELWDKQINLLPTTRVVKVVKNKNKFDIYTCSTQEDKKGFTDIANSTIKRDNFDLIVKAIGSKSDKHIEHEFIVYAGDCKIGGSTIVEAVASGIDSAKIIDKKLVGEKI
jgi:NADPH-dependent glutamate synthase beta subunit-like oxidoreductase